MNDFINALKELPEITGDLIAIVVSILLFVLTAIGNIILFFSNRSISKKNNKIQSENNRITAVLGSLQSEDEQKSRINNFVTENRIEWIQTLKKLTSNYFEEAYKLFDELPNEYSGKLTSIRLATNMIRIHIHFNGLADSYLLSNIFIQNRMIEIIGV